MDVDRVLKQASCCVCDTPNCPVRHLQRFGCTKLCTVVLTLSRLPTLEAMKTGEWDFGGTKLEQWQLLAHPVLMNGSNAVDGPDEHFQKQHPSRLHRFRVYLLPIELFVTGHLYLGNPPSCAIRSKPGERAQESNREPISIRTKRWRDVRKGTNYGSGEQDKERRGRQGKVHIDARRYVHGLRFRF